MMLKVAKMHTFVKSRWNHIVKICLDSFENNARQKPFLPQPKLCQKVENNAIKGRNNKD